jgi:hypothetical protein
MHANVIMYPLGLKDSNRQDHAGKAQVVVVGRGHGQFSSRCWCCTDSNSAVFQIVLFSRQRRSVHAYALQHWIEAASGDDGKTLRAWLMLHMQCRGEGVAFF